MPPRRERATEDGLSEEAWVKLACSPKGRSTARWRASPSLSLSHFVTEHAVFVNGHAQRNGTRTGQGSTSKS